MTVSSPTENIRQLMLTRQHRNILLVSLEGYDVMCKMIGSNDGTSVVERDESVDETLIRMTMASQRSRVEAMEHT